MKNEDVYLTPELIKNTYETLIVHQRKFADEHIGKNRRIFNGDNKEAQALHRIVGSRIVASLNDGLEIKIVNTLNEIVNEKYVKTISIMIQYETNNGGTDSVTLSQFLEANKH